MVKQSYIPARGDIVYVTFDPVRGHEQRGRRPALVLSSRRYNELVGLAVVCPITSHVKKYEFEVPVRLVDKASVVLSDHVRSLDWRKRGTTFLTSADAATLTEVVRNIAFLIAR